MTNKLYMKVWFEHVQLYNKEYLHCLCVILVIKLI